MRRLLTTLLLAATLAAYGAANGSPRRYRNITMDDGMPSNTVRTIVQDKFGFVWMGTDNGLCRYDGVNVVRYQIGAMGGNQFVSSLLATADGIYVGTERNVFMLRFDNGDFVPVNVNCGATITSLATDKEGNLWIATRGDGVWRWETKAARATRYILEEDGGSAGAVFVDRDNRVWTVSNWNEKPVCRFNRLRNRFEPVALDFGGNCQSMSMMQCADGSLWIGTWENGVLKLSDDGTVSQVFSPEKERAGNHIHAMAELNGDGVCVACDDGVLWIDKQTNRCSRLLDRSHAELTDRFAYTILCDDEGGVWIGTFYGGVDYVSPVSDRFEPVVAKEGRSDGLAGNVVSAFCIGRDGCVWIGTDDGGLSCYVPQTKSFRDFPHKSELRKQNIHTLAMDGNDLWIGTYSHGVFVMDTATGKMRHYDPSRKPCGLDNGSSYAILRDSEGRIWVATMTGLNRYDRENDRFETVKSLGVMTIDIDEDSEGCLWLATQGGGLYRYRPGNGEWKHYGHDQLSDLSLPTGDLNCICIDSEGNLWAGAMGGLLTYDKAKDRFQKIRLDIPNQNIMSIVESHDALWLSTENGIVSYVPEEGIQRFTREDGLTSDQFRPNACLQTANGQIFFGTTNGFNTFFPHQIKTNTSMAPVYITAIETPEGTKLTENGLPLDLSQTRAISIGYADAKMFAIDFAALSYCSPSKNQYAYRLEGFDTGWNYVANNHRATYTNLSAGTYTFCVRATNNDGVWSDNVAKLRIRVEPPLWWSWWAKLFYLALAGALIWWYVHYRLRRAEQSHRQELQRMKDEQEKEQREARLKFFTMIAHEIRTPVSLIIGPLEKLKGSFENREEGGETQSAKLKSQLSIIDRNAQRLLELVNQLLDFRKVEQNILTMSFSPQNISQLIHAVGDRFAPTFEQGGKKFEVDCPDERFTAIVDREGITKVVSNLLTNAIKYSRDEVRLTCLVEPDENSFRISVEDNGMGIREEDRERIFEPFFQATDNRPGTGIGLSIVKNIVDLHHGVITVDSEVGRGTRLTVILPVKQEMENSSEWREKSGESNEVSGERNENCEVTAANLKPQTSNLKPQTSSPQPQLPTMLIVDDNEDMVGFLAQHFSHTFNVLTAHDGIEALGLLEQNDISLVISDWMMPRMDGSELCRRMRQNPATSHISFVMLTAKTDDDSKIEGIDTGADIYIEKPFSIQYLEGSIRNIAEMRKRLQKRFASQPFEPLAQVAANATDNAFLQRMTQVIEENFANPDFSVNTLAEALAISRSGLFAKIKTLADMTPNEMIQIVRLKKATQLLKEGQHQINEICYMVGFSNPSYFSKCFQKQFGIKPGDFSKDASSAG